MNHRYTFKSFPKTDYLRPRSEGDLVLEWKTNSNGDVTIQYIPAQHFDLEEPAYFSLAEWGREIFIYPIPMDIPVEKQMWLILAEFCLTNIEPLHAQRDNDHFRNKTFIVRHPKYIFIDKLRIKPLNQTAEIGSGRLSIEISIPATQAHDEKNIEEIVKSVWNYRFWWRMLDGTEWHDKFFMNHGMISFVNMLSEMLDNYKTDITQAKREFKKADKRLCNAIFDRKTMTTIANKKHKKEWANKIKMLDRKNEV